MALKMHLEDAVGMCACGMFGGNRTWKLELVNCKRCEQTAVYQRKAWDQSHPKGM